VADAHQADAGEVAPLASAHFPANVSAVFKGTWTKQWDPRNNLQLGNTEGLSKLYIDDYSSNIAGIHFVQGETAFWDGESSEASSVRFLFEGIYVESTGVVHVWSNNDWNKWDK
jgi:hypothetical protein